MRIGLDGWKPEDADWFRELGITCTKLALSGFDEPADTAFETIEAAANAGLQVIVDIRPGESLHKALLDGLTKIDTEHVAACLKQIEDGAAATAKRLDGIATDIEFWGEACCPYVGGFYPDGSISYPVLLPAAYNGIKSAAPDMRVWNGGYGVNFQREFLSAIVDQCPESFDVANWHHYNVTDYAPIIEDEDGFDMPDMDLAPHRRIHYSCELFRKMFTAARAELTAAGLSQPFASSEWGMPVVSDDVIDRRKLIGLQHYVFQDGYFGLGDTEAAMYLNAWLGAFEEAGLQTLVYHRLRDGLPNGPDHDGTFWGVYCGLLYANGEPKEQMMQTFKRWIERGVA